MNSVDSIVDLFYNVIPGIIFLIILQFVYKVGIPPNDADNIFFIITLGFVLGFIFQAIVKFLREKLNFNNRWVFQHVINDDLKRFIRAKNLLGELDLVDKDETGDKWLEKRFHIMDNYLRSRPQSEIINHFASKAAFWSNIFIVSCLFIIIAPFKILVSMVDLLTIYHQIILVVFSISFLIISVWAATHYWRIQYNVVMTTFVAIINIELINVGKKKLKK